MNNKELLKEKRSKLLNELINKIKESIDKNKIDGEISSKIFIYSRLADYTYYSEVSIRKFLTGIVPKDISSFIEGISQYCKLVKVEDEYIEKFATEYIKLANAIVLELDSLIKTKNNLPPQDLTTIIRPRKLQNFIENFLKENVNISYIYGYKLSGKTKSIMAIMNDLINKSIYDNVIWIDIKENDKEINKIVDVITSFISIEETKIEEEVKKDECLKFLKSSNSILVIDFNNKKQENQTLYILKEIAQNTKIIIISSTNFKYYEDDLLSYSKVFCTNEYIEKDEFKNLLMNNNYTNANILNEQKFIDELYNLTGGMPFATISIIRKIIEENELGVPLKDSLEKYSNYKLKIYEDLAEKIIEENWNKLDDLAKKIIIISSKFNYSISIKLIAYICEVDIKSDKWKSSIKKCYDNNLLNHIILDNPRVYVNNMIKKLVLQYEEKEQFDNKNFLEKMANYYLNLSTYIGECYNDLDKLKLLDDFDCWNIVQEVLDYLMKNNMDKYYINIVRELKYYIYVRGIWQKGDDSLHLKRAHLAYKNGYINDYIEALCDYINICSKSRNNDDALKYINIVNKLVEENKDKIDKRIICLCNHVNALYLYNCKKDYFKCYNIWKDNKANYSNYVSKYRNLVNDLWLTRCYIKIEIDNKKIISLLESKIMEMRNENFVRAELDYELLLIGFLVKSIIDFKVDNDLIEKIEKELDKCHLLLNTKSNKDIRNEAQYFKYKAIVYFYKNDKKQANEFLEKAVKKYELMNCYDDIKELKNYINNIGNL